MPAGRDEHTAADQALIAHLAAEASIALAAEARIQLLSVKIAAEGVLRQWPDAAYVQMDYSDLRYDRRGAVAILHGDGEVLDDHLEAWTQLDNGADLHELVSNLSDDGAGGRSTSHPFAASRVWTCSQQLR